MKLLKNQLVLAGALALAVSAHAVRAPETGGASAARHSALRDVFTKAGNLVSDAHNARAAELSRAAGEGRAAPATGHVGAEVTAAMEAGARAVESALITLKAGFKTYGADGDAVVSQIGSAGLIRNGDAGAWAEVISALKGFDDATMQRFTSDVEYRNSVVALIASYSRDGKLDGSDQLRLQAVLKTISDPSTLGSLVNVNSQIDAAMVSVIPSAKTRLTGNARGQAKATAIKSLQDGLGVLEFSLTSHRSALASAQGDAKASLEASIADLESKVALYKKASDTLTQLPNAKFTLEHITKSGETDALLINQAIFDMQARKLLKERGLTDEEITFLLRECGVRA